MTRGLALTLLAVVVAAVVGASTWNLGRLPSRWPPSEGEPASLVDSLEPLRDHFNDNAHRRRLVALVSPNCLSAFYGFRAIDHFILSREPSPDISVIVVWTPLLPYDLENSTAARDGRIRNDPRVRRFWDAGGMAGRALAEVIGLEGAPFVEDIYLFWEAGDRWEAEPPPPAHWLHQLADADPARLRRGDALAPEIQRILEGTISRPPGARRSRPRGGG